MPFRRLRWNGQTINNLNWDFKHHNKAHEIWAERIAWRHRKWRIVYIRTISFIQFAWMACRNNGAAFDLWKVKDRCCQKWYGQKKQFLKIQDFFPPLGLAYLTSADAKPAGSTTFGRSKISEAEGSVEDCPLRQSVEARHTKSSRGTWQHGGHTKLKEGRGE